MRVVSFSEARNNLKQVIDSVVENADVTVITRRDAPDAVVMSLDTLNSWVETVHLLKTPANAAHLAKSIGQLRKGKSARTHPRRWLIGCSGRRPPGATTCTGRGRIARP